MANLSLRRVILYDRWPGTPSPYLGIPTGGFDATSGHSCVTAPDYPPMTKIQAYQRDASSCTGYYTMIYLAFNEMSGAMPLSCGSLGQPICGHADMTAWIDIGRGGDASNTPFYVTNCSACIDATLSAPIAVSCQKGLVTDATTAAAQWSWFWCGGVCPAFDMTQLDFDMTCTATSGKDLMPVVDSSLYVLGVGEWTHGSKCGFATKASA